MKIQVFKTNVQEQKEAYQIIYKLEKIMTKAKINFDLEDCDKILQIERTNKSMNIFILRFLHELDFYCEVLV